MATTTPNYGWAVPTSTDLVKDGATAIETLGDSIDASMFTALGTKKAGMVLLNTTTFSAVASQSFNNVFSATYTNYRIVFNVEHTVGLVVLNFRLRVSGTDATGANYNFQTLSGDNTISGGRSQNQTSSEIALISTSVGNNGSTDIYRPFLTNQTSFITQTISAYNSPYGRIYWGEHTPATSYDGFTIFPPSGNMTGTVSVYGYNK